MIIYHDNDDFSNLLIRVYKNSSLNSSFLIGNIHLELKSDAVL